MEFGKSIDQDIHRRVNEIETAIGLEKIEGVIETIPGYSTLLVLYDPLQLNYEILKEKLINLHAQIKNNTFEDPKAIKEQQTLNLPVVYGGEFGPDLEFVAKYHHLTPEEVIEIHSSVNYSVYILGTTGFAYLGDLPEGIHTPRLKTPRRLVPAGSIGIGNNQTGIYAVEGPSGWQLIGRTTFRIYDPAKEPAIFLRPNDNVKFIQEDAK
jgi:KipI family sensor histidine kinase inhibitor